MKFKLETEFQDTEIGKIPREWRVKKLGELVFEIYYGLTAKAVDQHTELRMLRTTDIKDNYSVDWDSLPYCEITDNRRGNIQKYLLRKNDLVVSRAGTTGMSILVDKDLNDVIFGSYLIKIKLNESVAYPKFIHYFMQSSLYWNQLLPKQAGSTLKNISLPILKNILTPLPPISEQKLIPEILSTLDRAIEVVDAGVVRLEGLKKALMRELLTGRIRVREENGKPVFYRETEFQDTEIGKVPREWKVVRLENVLLLLRNGLNAKQNKDGIGYPITRIETISEEKIDVSKVGYVSGLTGVDVEKYRLIEGDILFSHINSLEHIGKAAINEGVPELLLHGVNLLLLRPDKKKVYPKFLLYLLHLYRERKVFWAIAKRAVNQASINQTELKNMKIFLPSLNEQVRIAEILSTVDRAIELYREEGTRLDRLKRGLMDLLLTGRVRVVREG